MQRLAQINIAPGGGFKGPGTGILADTGNPSGTLEQVITNAIGVMTVVAAIWFIFVLLTGAIAWISAGSDKGAVESARKRIGNGVTGLVIVVIATFIASLVGQIIGLDILNLASLIDSIPR